jgi:hypothetical protein
MQSVLYFRRILIRIRIEREMNFEHRKGQLTSDKLLLETL